MEKKFEEAVLFIQGLPKEGDGTFTPSNAQKLQFYSLYKQATEGACRAPQPSFYQVTERYKWGAWSELGEMPKEEARKKYVELLLETARGFEPSEMRDNLIRKLTVDEESKPSENEKLAESSANEAEKSSDVSADVQATVDTSRFVDNSVEMEEENITLQEMDDSFVNLGMEKQETQEEILFSSGTPSTQLPGEIFDSYIPTTPLFSQKQPLDRLTPDTNKPHSQIKLQEEVESLNPVQEPQQKAAQISSKISRYNKDMEDLLHKSFATLQPNAFAQAEALLRIKVDDDDDDDYDLSDEERRERLQRKLLVQLEKVKIALDRETLRLARLEEQLRELQESTADFRDEMKEVGGIDGTSLAHHLQALLQQVETRVQVMQAKRVLAQDAMLQRVEALEKEQQTLIQSLSKAQASLGKWSYFATGCLVVIPCVLFAYFFATPYFQKKKRKDFFF